MTNSLRKLAKDLKAFAKRCKDFKYTEQALFVFLLCGIVGFADVTTAPTDKAIQNQRQEITTSIGDMRQQFKRVKSENDKLMKNYNLELIQLMEQGDHVVKSPWSSWQYGANTILNDWRGTYKGKGNKIKDNGVYKRSQTLSRYLESPVIEKNANNTTTLGFVYEPNAEIPISASITPKSISKTNPNIQKNVAIASLPSFEPRVVNDPLAPSVIPPTIGTPAKFEASAISRGNTAQLNYDNATGLSVIEGIAATAGTFNINRNNGSNTYYYTDYSGINSLSTATTRPGGDPAIAKATGATWNGLNRGSSTSQVNFTESNKFFRLVETYGTLLSNLDVNLTSNTTGDLAELVHLDLHGGQSITSQRAGIINALTNTTVGTPNIDTTKAEKILKAYDKSISYSNKVGLAGAIVPTTDIGKVASTFTNTGMVQAYINSGTIKMKGSGFSLTNSYEHNGGSNHRAIVVNAGNIEAGDTGSSSDTGNAVFVVSNDVVSQGNSWGFTDSETNANTAQQVIYNSGNIAVNSKNSTAYLLDPYLSRPINIVNTDGGTVKIAGEKSTGIYVKDNINLGLNFTNSTVSSTPAGTGDYTKYTTATAAKDTTSSYNPITIIGNESVGLYVSSNIEAGSHVSPNNPNTKNKRNPEDSVITGLFGVDIGDTVNKDVKKSTGIYSASALNLQGHQIRIFNNTSTTLNSLGKYDATGNIGVTPSNDKELKLGDGIIYLEGGNQNIGIALDKKGTVTSSSNIILEGGNGNLAIYSDKGNSTLGDVTVNKITSDNTQNSIAIYATGGTVVKVSDKMTINNATVTNNPTITNGATSGAVYATGSGTTVTINYDGTNTGTVTTPTTPNINITGKEIVDPITGAATGNYAGFGLYAAGGAIINAKNNNVKVTNGGTAVASTGGSSSVVDLTGGTVEYDGKGYALHSANGGQINLSNGTLTLRGEATGYSSDVTLTTQPITLTSATLNVFSDDVIVTNLKGVNTFNTNGSIINNANSIGTYIPIASIVNIDPATGTTYNAYKYTVLDGITVNIDSNIDKADTTATPAPSDSYIFTRRLQLQNSNLNVASGNTVKAHLNTTEINDINSKLTVPVGLDISASGKSTSRATTGVNVANGATITVDRTDSGNGGVGAYVNYGTVTNDGKIEVEKLTPNDHAVGIYATNGTIVNNNATGTVEVGGKDSIGILGLSYRIDSKNNVVYEKFNTGGAASDGIGLVDITNKGKITLDGDNALGIYAKNNSLDATGVNAGYLRNSTSNTSATNDGEITLTGKNAIGMITEGGKITNDSNGKITINGQEGVAMYGTVAKDSATPTVNKVHSQLINKGTITLADTTATTPIIGMFTNDPDTSITTSGTINVGKKSYGVYGASNNVSMTGGAINVGDDGVGIFATGSSDTTTPTSTVNLSGGTITVGTNKAVGVFIADDANHPLKTTVTNTGTNVNVGNDSFGYVVDSTTGTDLILGSATNKLTSSLDTDSVYVYSNDKNGFVYSNTDITTNGGKIYGLYTTGRAENYGNMDLRGGTGNVGIYSTGTSPTGAGATNYGTITVGGTNLTAKEYGIGMATGYYNETTGAISNEGLIENRGTLNVVGDNSIGMYAVGSGSKAINAAGATIDISGKNATGMYIDHEAEGINYGTIKSTGSATGIKGVATVNGGYIKNYGTIAITSPDGIGIYQDAASSLANKNVPGNVSGTKKAVYTATSTDEKYIVSPKGSLLIQNPPRTPRLVVNGKEVELRGLDTNVASPTPSYVTAGVTTLDLSLPEFEEFKNSPSNAQASELGMYIDTSGVNYTNPIQGLNNLIGLDAINLIIGTEAAKYTDAKAIEIGDNILTPYNNAISSLTTTGTKLNINAAGLTWLAQPVQGATKPIETLYMVKIPYTYFTSPKDENTYNFLDGLEQRYGVDGYGARGAREKLLFNKLNGIGKGETHIFTQAVDEMKGHQYANTQQRINETGSLLDDEFKYLHDEWRNPSKQNNKIKIFGIRNEYNTDTAGIIDYTSNAYGVAYVHEDETVKLGNSSGWYAGAVNNRFRFKDNGKSKENQTMLKAGIFKTMSPYMDHNGSLRWTVAGDVFVGQNEMKRRFLVVDDIFSAKGDYTSYGAAFKTDLGYDIRMSERTHLRPYGALKMEYGRFNNIKEDDGEMRLEVKGNDYFSVKPEVGVQFKYVQPLAVRTQLSVGLTAAYENELGKLQERRNQARVGYTDAGWYNLEQEKENRRGNGKFDFNLGVDNTRFGVTVNAGYDTKGSNIRGGIGFRAIY